MGLYKRLTEGKGPVCRNAEADTGLLNKADKVPAKTVPAAGGKTRAFLPIEKPFEVFHEFAEELGIERMGIFIPCGDRFFMLLSHGFDRESVCLFRPSAEFWTEITGSRYIDGSIIQEDGKFHWETFTGPQLSPFYPFLSETEKKNVQALHTKTLVFRSGQTCVLLIAESLLNTSRKQAIDLEAVDLVLPSVLDFAEQFAETVPDDILKARNDDTEKLRARIENICAEGRGGTMMEISMKNMFDRPDWACPQTDTDVLYDETVKLLKTAAGCSGVFYRPEPQTVRIVLPGREELDVPLYTIQLKKTLAPFFQEKTADYIETAPCGFSCDAGELEMFLLRG